MRVRNPVRREPVQVVTEAQRSKSDDIRYRERRYLIMMGIRVVCFLVAVLMFVNHAGWLTAIPAVGAIAIPYFAVVLANAGREPNAKPGFREYAPSLPDRFGPPDPSTIQGRWVRPGEAGPPGAAGPTGGPGPTGGAGRTGGNGQSGRENQR